MDGRKNGCVFIIRRPGGTSYLSDLIPRSYVKNPAYDDSVAFFRGTLTGLAIVVLVLME